jgi:hypothetical protein
MDAYATHGAFSWCELMTTDPDAARSFYGRLLGWGSRAMEMPSGKYTVFQVGETSVGGMMKIAADSPSQTPAWGCYITVKDVDATCRRATELGGKVLLPAMDVPTVGRMAMIRDPQGAVFSVISYSMQNA